MVFHILRHIYLHSHLNSLMHKLLHQYFLNEQILSMSFVPFLINTRINVSEISTTKLTFFYYFNWCFIWDKTHICNTPLSYVTELFNFSNVSFLLIPINKHLKVVPFALNAKLFKE